jgi:hypothetical protein
MPEQVNSANKPTSVGVSTQDKKPLNIIKNIFLLLLPIAFIMFGYYSLDFAPLPIINLLFIFPYFEILIILLTIFVIWKVFKDGRVKIFLLLFLPIYILLLVGIFFESQEVFGVLWLANTQKTSSEYGREQHNETIKIGKIINTGNSISYECQKCGFKITFPNNWGYEEEAEQFMIYTPNYEFTSLKFSGQRFWVKYTARDPFYLFQQATSEASLKTDTFNVGTSNVKTVVYKATFTQSFPPKKLFLSFDSPDKNMHFGIQADYQDEQEMNQNLNILLKDFVFLNQ